MEKKLEKIDFSNILKLYEKDGFSFKVTSQTTCGLTVKNLVEITKVLEQNNLKFQVDNNFNIHLIAS
jgi:hypothetical protein